MIMDTVLAKDVITVQAPVCRHVIAAPAVIAIECGDTARASASRTGQWRCAGAERGAQQRIGNSQTHEGAILRDLGELAQVSVLEVEVNLLLVACVRNHANGVRDLLGSPNGTQDVA